MFLSELTIKPPNLVIFGFFKGRLSDAQVKSSKETRKGLNLNEEKGTFRRVGDG